MNSYVSDNYDLLLNYYSQFILLHLSFMMHFTKQKNLYLDE